MRATIITVLCALIAIATLSSCDNRESRIAGNKTSRELQYADSLISEARRSNYDAPLMEYCAEASASREQQYKLYRVMKGYVGETYRVEYKAISRQSSIQ